MGQVAEDMVDGTCCDSCGCYFRDATAHALALMNDEGVPFSEIADYIETNL